MFKDTKSDGLASIQFLSALGFFFRFYLSIPKHAITESYKNLSYETLSCAQDLEFEAISNLVGEMKMKIKNATLSNIERKEEQDKKSRLDIKNSHYFLELAKKFEEELKEDLFKDLGHKQIEHSYVEPLVQDAETIEIETKEENEEFDYIFSKYKEIDNASTEQKRQNDIIDLIDVVLDESNPFNTMKTETEDIFIDDDLLDDTDQKDKKIFRRYPPRYKFGSERSSVCRFT